MNLRNCYSRLNRGPMPDTGGILYLKAQNARLIHWATAVPANGTAGYAEGGLLMLRALTAGVPQLFINTGTHLACQFEELGEVSNDFGAAGIIADVIAEYTPAHGVLVDSVLCKDGKVQGTACILTDTIAEFTPTSGVTIDSVLLKDGKVQGTACVLTDTIGEFTSTSGVTIDGALIKDGKLQGAACILTNTIDEFTGASGVTIDGALIKDGQLQGTAPILCDTISEFTPGAGVTADGVKMKDGDIDMSAASGFDIIVPDNQASAFRLLENGNEILKAVTTNGAELLASTYRFALRNAASLAATGAGVDNSDAAQIVSQLTRITGGDGTKGVKMPASNTAGDFYICYNDSASTVRFWSATNEQINNITMTNYLSLGARFVVILFKIGTNAAGNPGWGAIQGTMS